MRLYSSPQKLFFLLIVVLFGFFNSSLMAGKSKKSSDKPKEEKAKVDLKYYVSKLTDNNLEITSNGEVKSYIITTKTRFKYGFDEIPRKFIRPTMEVREQVLAIGSALEEIEVIPVFKFKKTKKSDSHIYFISLEDGVLEAKILGQNTLLRVNAFTTFINSSQTIKPEEIKKGTLISLSSTTPWSLLSTVEVVGGVMSAQLKDDKKDEDEDKKEGDEQEKETSK